MAHFMLIRFPSNKNETSLINETNSDTVTLQRLGRPSCTVSPSQAPETFDSSASGIRISAYRLDAMKMCPLCHRILA